MRLQDFFPQLDCVGDCRFATLAPADTDTPGSLVYADTPRHLRLALENTNVAVLLVPGCLSGLVPSGTPHAVTDAPRSLFFELHAALAADPESGYHPDFPWGIHPSARIHPTAHVSERCHIGEEVAIEALACVQDHTFLDQGVHVHAGACIGSDGLLYATREGAIEHVPHAGGVRIARRAHVLAGAVIARSVHPHRLTEVGENSIIGIRSVVGHEAVIGKNCTLSSGCNILRRAHIGDETIVGPGCTIREHVVVGQGSRIRLGSVVIENLPPGADVSGNFATDHRQRIYRYMRERNRRSTGAGKA